MDTNKATLLHCRATRQRLINETVEALQNRRTDIMLVMGFYRIMESADIPLIMAAHKAVGQRVVDAVMKATTAQDPQCPLYESLQESSAFNQKIEHAVSLYKAGYAPQ